MSYTYSDELYSDLHKDAIGCRPSQDSYANWASKTPDEKQAEWNYLLGQQEEAENEYAAYEKANIIKFEAMLSKIMGNGAGSLDRATAIKWIFDAEENKDPDYYCFNQGLPYGYFN